jgi:hypothetical protein
MQLYMKKILIFAGIVSLLATTGCIVADDGHRHARYEHHDEVIVGPPVVVRPPEVIVRPPDVIVR